MFILYQHLLKLVKEQRVFGLDVCLVVIESMNVVFHVFPVSLERVVLLHDLLVVLLLFNLEVERILSRLVSFLIRLDIVILNCDYSAQLLQLVVSLVQLLLVILQLLLQSPFESALQRRL